MRDEPRSTRPGDPRELSHPPSDPHPSVERRRSLAWGAAEDRPIRVQLVLALLLGLVLVVGGLLWRRPMESSDPQAAEAATAGSAASAIEDAGVRPLLVDAAPPPVALSGARVLGCHDRGPRVTSPEDCDRLGAIEEALSHAIEESSTCFPATDQGATIEYVADVSFSHHRVRISLPRAGRSTRDRRVVTACGAAVRDAMHGVALEGIDHKHARYEISVTATYRGKT